jgi:hypothetical protein
VRQPSAAAARRPPVAEPPRPRQQQQQQQSRDPHERFRRDDFPWSQEMHRHLRRTFGIQQFRDHQKEIINATMSGHDVFVIMRTGGGKSLTYQLPALLEGRVMRERKVTFVISPLLSLIQDQEEQMNAFAPGSAVSFTSGMKGGSSEHARRWGLVRDPTQGVCLVFVTPEKVSKSNKLCSEMEKLFAKGRLARFVIDESHCATQWGHGKSGLCDLSKLCSNVHKDSRFLLRFVGRLPPRLRLARQVENALPLDTLHRRHGHGVGPCPGRCVQDFAAGKQLPLLS